MAVVGLSLVSASGLRHFRPELKEAMQAPAFHVADLAARAQDPRLVTAGAGPAPKRAQSRPAPLPPPTFTPPWTGALLVLAPIEALGLGVSIPKRRRWAVLGGHGRNGVG